MKTRQVGNSGKRLLEKVKSAKDHTNYEKICNFQPRQHRSFFYFSLYILVKWFVRREMYCAWCCRSVVTPRRLETELHHVHCCHASTRGKMV